MHMIKCLSRDEQAEPFLWVKDSTREEDCFMRRLTNLQRSNMDIHDGLDQAIQGFGGWGVGTGGYLLPRLHLHGLLYET